MLNKQAELTILKFKVDRSGDVCGREDSTRAVLVQRGVQGRRGGKRFLECK